MTLVTFQDPVPGSSLLLAFQPRTVLVIGANRLAAVRALSALETGADVLIASTSALSEACEELQWRIQRQQARYTRLDDTTHERIIRILDSEPTISLACVTDTLLVNATDRRSLESATIIRDACRSRRVPVNVTDIPSLCDFTFPSTHRFSSKPSSSTSFSPSPPPPLQIAVTTNGQGCRLAGRIRREISTKLHPSLGSAVANVARLRAIAKNSQPSSPPHTQKGDREDDAGAALPLNSPAPQLSVQNGPIDEDPIERVARRMRWVNQISEYWPIERLAELGEKDMEKLLELKNKNDGVESDVPTTRKKCSAATSDSLVIPSNGHDASRHSLPLSPSNASPPPQGQILLVGSGTGHPSMLTIAAHKALTSLATRVLSDKLVPSEILALIPKHIPVYIAKKYPGNSEGAQNELMEMAVEGARKGETVVRLKQGDPFLYGRGGEEILYFRTQGFEPLVIPGISSALAAPSFFNIPVTQRGVSESLIICTGVGRRGKSVTLPAYERSRTLVVLMGVARLNGLLSELRAHSGGSYPGNLPIAIIERASSPDQRLIAGTIETIERVLEGVGEQRTPGMIVIGWVVLALEGAGDLDVLDDVAKEGESIDELDTKRLEKWFAGRGGVVKDGLGREWEQFL